MFCIGISLILGEVSYALGQNEPIAKKAENPSGCENIKHALDYTMLDAKNSQNSKIIFIFYLGKGEFSKNLTALRMSNIEKFLQAEIPNLKPFVMAEGKRRDGLGKIEIYTKGELNWELFFNKNASDCVE
jgi:hypothetical protein